MSFKCTGPIKPLFNIKYLSIHLIGNKNTLKSKNSAVKCCLKSHRISIDIEIKFLFGMMCNFNPEKLSASRCYLFTLSINR